MNNRTSLIVGIIVIIVLIGGFLWWSSSQSSTSSNSPTATAPSSASETPQAPAAVPPPPEGAPATPDNSNSGAANAPVAGKTVFVTYTSQGFSPQSVTVKQGDTVQWSDTSGDPMWVASNPHPIHTGYDGTSRATHCAAGYTGPTPFDQCTSGNTYSFTFGKTGTWGYHNHNDPQDTGTIIVQ